MVSARVSTPAEWCLATAAALGIDALFGDEPLRPHPVACFGRAMGLVEKVLWDDRRGPGLAYAGTGIAAAALAGSVVGRLPAGATCAGYVSIAARGLWDAAGRVEAALSAGDLARARAELPALVGRDPAGLSAGEVARAAVESVAENTADGIVGPALFGAALGPVGVLAYRGINTLDSMVGYRDERYGRFGWASARADDLANLVPARLTALLVALVRPTATVQVWRAARGGARSHPSPNAGVAEAAFAAALGVRLGGTNSYGGVLEERPVLGSERARPAGTGDIDAAVRCSKDVTAALAALLTGIGLAAAEWAPARWRAAR
jgi:adenosylcobinamide-phosphate synthase